MNTRVIEALEDFENYENGLPVSIGSKNPATLDRHIGRDRLAHLAACPICRARAKAVLTGKYCEGTAVVRFSD
jgi:hypothetical protein